MFFRWTVNAFGRKPTEGVSWAVTDFSQFLHSAQTGACAQKSHETRMRRDFLHDLVQALSSVEVGMFRKSEFLSTGKWSAERRLLFNALPNYPDLTLKQTQAQFCINPYLKVFLKERHRIHPSLCRFFWIQGCAQSQRSGSKAGRRVTPSWHC
jgi:hypothetical protein